VPEGRGDQSFDGSRSDLVANALGLGASLVDPPPVLQLAAVHGVDHEVADATRAPEALRALATDSSTVSGVVGRYAERVEVASDHPAALATDGETLVDVADEIGCALVGPDDGPVGHKPGGGFETFDAVSKGHDAARVAALAGRAAHPVRRSAQEHPPVVVRDGGKDVPGKEIGLALETADEPDAPALEPATDGCLIGSIAPETIELVDPHLVEQAGLGVREKSLSVGPLCEWRRACHPVIDVAPDQLDAGLAREETGDLVGLGLDGLALALVLGADSLVGRHAPDPCYHGHRTPP
jgi:hypothetical protein